MDCSFKKIAACICLFASLAGCVTKDLSNENRQLVKSIWIVPIDMSLGKFKYNSMDQAWEAGLGAGVGVSSGMVTGSKISPAVLAGASAASATNNSRVSPAEAIRLNMQRNDIDVGVILRERLEARITKEKLFTITPDAATADAKIEFIVTEWGVSLKNFSTELYPTIGLSAVMRRGDEQIWRNFETITALSDGNDLAFTPQRYATDPEALRTAFGHAVDLMVDKLMIDLKQ